MKNLNVTIIIFIQVLLSTEIVAQQWNGYTLYSLQNSTAAYLMDTNLVTYHSWTGFTNQTGYSTYLMPGGTLVRSAKGATVPTGAPGGPICGIVQKFDYSGAMTWNYTYAGTDYISHHDICPMPNGNVLLIAYERKTAAEVTAAGGTNAIQMWPDKIVEIQPTGATTGTVVWEWHTWDHLVQNKYSTKANYVSDSINFHPELLNINYKQAADWQHMNGVDYNPILDQIAFSSHNFSEWYIIDHSTTTAQAATHAGGNSGKGGDILYRWGNPAAYNATGTQILNVTHDAHWIPEGVPNAGRLCGFNNQSMGSVSSFADEIDVPKNGYNYNITLGSAFAPTTYTYRHTVNGFSSNMGSTQQLPNGNRLICVATQSKIYEINGAGTQLWSKTFTSAVPQARKYDSCFIFNTAPAIPTITQSGNTLTSTSATTYQWYLNGVQINGATSQSYNITQSGVYIVRITDANGCVYQYAVGINAIYVPGAISSFDFSNEITVYPNPANDRVYLQSSYLQKTKDFTLNLFDVLGNKVYHSKNTTVINTAALPNGTYHIQVLTNEGSALKKLQIVK